MAKLKSSCGEREGEIEWKAGEGGIEYPVDLCQALNTLNNTLAPIVEDSYRGDTLTYWQERRALVLLADCGFMPLLHESLPPLLLGPPSSTNGPSSDTDTPTDLYVSIITFRGRVTGKNVCRRLCELLTTLFEFQADSVAFGRHPRRSHKLYFAPDSTHAERKEKRRELRERDHSERLSARDEVGGPLLRCLVQMLLLVEKRLCIEKKQKLEWYEPDSDLLGKIFHLTHACLQYSGHLHLDSCTKQYTWSTETALSTEECCVLAGCVSRLSKRLDPDAHMSQSVATVGWEDVLISLLEVPGTYCRECGRGVYCECHSPREKREGSLGNSPMATSIAQAVWESGVLAHIPPSVSLTTTLLYSLLYSATGAEVEWPKHVLDATGFSMCYSLAARAGLDLPAGARLLLPSFIPPTKSRYTETVSPPSDYFLRSYRHADIVSLPLSTVEEWASLLTGVVRAGAKDHSLLADLLPVMEDVMSPFVVCLSDELVVALSDLVESVATGIRTDAADTSQLDLVIQLAAAIARVEADYHGPGTYTASRETQCRATEGYTRRACTSAMVDAGLVGLIHTWMVAVSEGSCCDTSLADT
ncbi:hypothetical protein KIPB_010599, partial [Kipferlia bialata]|eukprot:g10599.t1